MSKYSKPILSVLAAITGCGCLVFYAVLLRDPFYTESSSTLSGKYSLRVLIVVLIIFTISILSLAYLVRHIIDKFNFKRQANDRIVIIVTALAVVTWLIVNLLPRTVYPIDYYASSPTYSYRQRGIPFAYASQYHVDTNASYSCPLIITESNCGKQTDPSVSYSWLNAALDFIIGVAASGLVYTVMTRKRKYA